MKPPKIAFLLYSMTGGGIERTVSILLKYLRNYEIHLVLFNEPIEYELPQDIKVHLLRCNSGWRFLRLLTLPLVAIRYWKYCKGEDISKSISFDSICNFINCTLKLTTWRGACYLYEANYISARFPANTWFGRVHRFLIQKLYPLSDKLLVNENRIAADLESSLNVKHPSTELVLNPIDFQLINTQNFSVRLLKKRFVFLHVGGFRTQKNHNLLIDAFFLLKHLDIELFLLGKGELETSIQEKVKKLGLSSCVFFEGFQPDPFAYMHQADCMVLCSDYEGSPNVLMEGLACGLPVISTDCPSGPRTLLAPDTDSNKTTQTVELAKYGILTPVSNVLQLANAMQLMYEDMNLRQQYKAIARRGVEHFHAELVTRRFEELLK